MSKVITFSRQFPAYHQRAGLDTCFVEKIWKFLGYDIESDEVVDLIYKLNSEQNYLTQPFFENLNYGEFDPKGHTIRSGHRWKVGDKFSPRVWSGKPYNSKQIIIAPDIEIVSTWHFAIYDGVVVLDGVPIGCDENVAMIAKNDGLELQDFYDWFQYPKQFDGQIICWNPDIKYHN